MSSNNNFYFNLKSNEEKISEKDYNEFLKNLSYEEELILESIITFNDGFLIFEGGPEDTWRYSYHYSINKQLKKIQNDFEIKLQGSFIWYEDDSEGTHIDRYEYAGDGTVKHFYINQEWEDDEPNKDDERWKEIA